MHKNAGRAVAAMILAAVLITGLAGGGMTRNAHAAESCNCVVFRVDDIQDEWIPDVQRAVLDAFIQSGTPASPALIMNEYGTDPAIVDKIQEGKDAGLFELALHGLNHVDYATLSLADQESTLKDANDKLATLHGQKTNIFVTPYNSMNENTMIAAKNDGIDIVSADTFDDSGYLPQIYPPTDSTGTNFLPMTVDEAVFEKPEGANAKTEEQDMAEIHNSISQYGFAIVMVHPVHYAVHTPLGEGNEQNIVDTDQLNVLKSLIQHVKDEGITVTSFNGILNMISNDAPPSGTDKIRPTGSITSPAPESVVQTGVPFDVQGTASDNAGVSKVEVRAAKADNTVGTSYAPATLTEAPAPGGGGQVLFSYSLTIPTTQYDTLVARITDSSGNMQWVTEHLTMQQGPVVDGARPQVAITAPTDGQAVEPGSTLTVTGTASDDSQLSKVEVRATTPDGSAGTTYAQATLTPDGKWSIDLPMTNSAYTLVVARATDGADNQNWATVPVSLDGSGGSGGGGGSGGSGSSGDDDNDGSGGSGGGAGDSGGDDDDDNNGSGGVGDGSGQQQTETQQTSRRPVYDDNLGYFIRTYIEENGAAGLPTHDNEANYNNNFLMGAYPINYLFTIEQTHKTHDENMTQWNHEYKVVKVDDGPIMHWHDLTDGQRVWLIQAFDHIRNTADVDKLVADLMTAKGSGGD